MMKNTNRVTFAALLLAGVFGLAAITTANAESGIKLCSDYWKVAKATGTTNSQTWQEFLNACRERLAAPPQPVSAPPAPATAQQQTTPKLMLSPGQYLDNTTGNVYQYVAAPGITWQQAFTQAASKSINGVSGYLATITSQAELDFIENTVIPGGTATGNVYIGGRQVAPGKWVWAAGPKLGSIFWNKGPVGAFAAWDPIYSLSRDAPAPTNSPRMPYVYLNSWYRPYFTSSWGSPLSSVNAGGNSGYVVEYSGVGDISPPIAASAGASGPQPQLQPTASVDSANALAASSTSADQTEEAKVEQKPPPSWPEASPTFPLSPPGRRVALIVANGAYPEAPLANPTIDADIVARSLEKIGFLVTVKKDLDLDGFEQAILEFGDATRGAEIALFYFAGHGFSVAAGGRQQNLLMPTSANFFAKTALALQGGGEPLEHVEETIIGRARATLIFIDACRNIPALAKRGVGSRGFAPLDASDFEGAYVVLSTRVGQTAEDGESGQGSPFARAFASVLPTPGLRIEDAYYRMREQVRRETSGAQVPDSIRSDLPEGGVVLVGGNVQ